MFLRYPLNQKTIIKVEELQLILFIKLEVRN